MFIRNLIAIIFIIGMVSVIFGKLAFSLCRQLSTQWMFESEIMHLVIFSFLMCEILFFFWIPYFNQTDKFCFLVWYHIIKLFYYKVSRTISLTLKIIFKAVLMLLYVNVLAGMSGTSNTDFQRLRFYLKIWK